MFGPTGGYIWAYVVAVYLMSALKGKTYNLKRYSLVAIVIGIPIIYLGGAIQLHFVTEMPGLPSSPAASYPSSLGYRKKHPGRHLSQTAAEYNSDKKHPTVKTYFPISEKARPP